MIFWHVGGATFLFRYLFRDPAVDLRFLAVGAVVSDLLDKPVGRIFWAEHFQTGRIYGHTLLFFVVVLAGVMVITQRGTQTRKRWVAFSVGVMFHLILDGMWTIPETLFWPLFGWEFPLSTPDYWSGLLSRLLSDPIVIAQEAIGLVYVTYLWRAAKLSDPERRHQVLRTGTITTPTR